jgi:putative hydrolase of HD superfamily
MLALFHDVTEARFGDIPSVGQKYLDKPNEDKVAWDQISGAPLPVVEAFTSLIREFCERRTPEARLAHEADKLECLAQATEYEADGYPRARQWIGASQAALESQAGRSMAAAMRSGDPDRWWTDFVTNYRSPAEPSPSASPAQARQPTAGTGPAEHTGGPEGAGQARSSGG